MYTVQAFLGFQGEQGSSMMIIKLPVYPGITKPILNYNETIALAIKLGCLNPRQITKT